jgi:hypothetical protein
VTGFPAPYTTNHHEEISFREGLSVTAREEIHEAALAVCSSDRIAYLSDIVTEMKRRGTKYKESTIRTHVTSRLCANAPDHHAVTYSDFEHVGSPASGLYRLLF